MLGLHAHPQVVGPLEGQGRSFQSDAGTHVTHAGAGVDGRGEDERAHAALLVIVARLEQGRRFTGIHRRVVKIDFGHSGFT